MFEDTLSYLRILTQKSESWVSLCRGTSHRAAEKQRLNGRADVVLGIKVTHMHTHTHTRKQWFTQTLSNRFRRVLQQIAFSPNHTTSKLYLFFLLHHAQTAAESGSQS